MGEIVKYPENVCRFCKKSEATLLCDFVIDPEVVTHYNCRTGHYWEVTTMLCDKPMCENCATKVEHLDFCPICINKLKEILK